MVRRNSKLVSSYCLWMILFVVLACEKTEYEMYEPVLNIYGVLRNDLTRQRIIVDRTYKIDEVAEFDLEDVKVILSGGGICDTLAALSDTIGFFETTKDFPILSETEYELVVSARNLDTLTGSTTIPIFEVLSPLNQDTVNFFQDTIVIMASGPENRFGLSYTYYDSMLGDTTSQNFYWISSDHNTRLELPVSWWFPYYPSKYNVRILTADTNYFDYLFEEHEIDSVYSCGVTGGAGLFGSIWVESLTIYLDTTQNVRKTP